jgi:NTE family protein
MTKSVGIALGGGGARGLAHISVLQVLDDLGVNVTAISGTSIGAVIGSLFASGMTAREVRQSVDDLLAMPKSFEQARQSKRLFGWLDLLGLEFGRSHLLETESFISELQQLLGVDNFEDLKIPMQVVAADFWGRKEVVLDSGPVIPAVAASFCLPGVFKPVVIDGTVLVDGGCVNPVPFDLIRDQCDILIAVDVMGKRVPQDDLMPSYSEAVFNTFQIAEKIITDHKIRSQPPDIYVEPCITDVKVLEFRKADQIHKQTQSACQKLATELKAMLLE